MTETIMLVTGAITGASGAMSNDTDGKQLLLKIVIIAIGVLLIVAKLKSGENIDSSNIEELKEDVKDLAQTVKKTRGRPKKQQ